MMQSDDNGLTTLSKLENTQNDTVEVKFHYNSSQLITHLLCARLQWQRDLTIEPEVRRVRPGLLRAFLHFMILCTAYFLNQKGA